MQLSFYSERSQDSKRLNDLSKITYLINGKARNRFHISWFPSNTISIKWNWLLIISGELKIKPMIYELFQLSTPQLYIFLFLYSSLTVLKKKNYLFFYLRFILSSVILIFPVLPPLELWRLTVSLLLPLFSISSCYGLLLSNIQICSSLFLL